MAKKNLVAKADALGLETEGKTDEELLAAIAEAEAEDKAAVGEKPPVEKPSVETPKPGKPAKVAASSDPTKKYVVETGAIVGGVSYTKGAKLTLTEKQAAPLLKHGAVRVA